MAENLKSNPVTNLDASVIVVGTSGEGATGYEKALSDYVSPTSSAAQWSTYRLSRFPTNAKVKHVWTYLSGIDTTTGTTAVAATLDFNVAFSDSTTDGTQAVLQGTIPSSKLDGTSLAFVSGTGYSTAYNSTGTGNKMFGSGIVVSTAALITELTFKNSFTPPMREDDLWNSFGFVNAQGTAQDPGGKFDIFVVQATALTKATAGVIGVEVDYVL
ncbi:MAG TPA: hypothetical protein VFA81_10670 [Burkholderiales bacterium]|nr:hypothetical protein [Burkholderiales bacterium]